MCLTRVCNNKKEREKKQKRRTNERTKNIYKATRNSMKIKMGNKILPCSPPMLLCVLPNAIVGVRKKFVRRCIWKGGFERLFLVIEDLGEIDISIYLL